MKITRFEPQHLKRLVLQDRQQYLADLCANEDHARALATLEAYTCFDNGEPVAVCGVLEHHAQRAELWALFSESAGPVMRQITKAARGWIAQAPYPRIEIQVQEDHQQGHRWAKMLGFQVEAVLEGLMPGGANGVMYKIVRK